MHHFTFEATEAQREMKKLMKPDLYISSKTCPMLKQNEAEYVFPSFSSIFVYFKTCVTVHRACSLLCYFRLHHMACVILVPRPGIEPSPSTGSRVLTTRPVKGSPLYLYVLFLHPFDELFEACIGLKYLCHRGKAFVGISKENAKQRIVF